ncbi:MAG: tannase/feruloyl esterase family alpha/beta hydrolase [Sphingopyxis sp.]|nr:tannase/feruloyl esterase family alpha/beta hydrolase [Sphingopyxis sp.]
MDDRCANLPKLTLDKAVVETATLSDGICRINGTAHPVPGSDIRFTVYLPAPERWNGRYYQIGNGGFAGAIHLPTLDEGARRGDAIAATDTGHRGHGFDASWAPGNLVALADYGWRSIKATRDAAATLVGAYYGRAPKQHYFMGCSNGGRMALMAAARWPEDWSGIIAGAPANPWTRQFRNFGLVQDAMLAPGGWLGAAERSQAKLSTPQRATLNAIVAAGYEPAAITADDWARWIANPDTAAQSQLTFAEQSRAYLFGHFSDETLAAELDIKPGDLKRFRDRGGKILSYFGQSDPVIAPGLGVDWYRDVQRATRGNTADFYRLFMIPGMSHCQGGAAATNFGQSLDAPAVRQDREHDVRLALEAWVERGIAPTALKSEAGSKRTVISPLR